MRINIEEAVEFLDCPPKSDLRQATSIIGLLGEDLNTYAFKHYMENEEKAKVEVINCPVTTGHQKGNRLDRWICIEKNGEKILYQCEIKNWAATAIGGRRLEKNANNDKILEVAEKNWEGQLKESFSDPEYPNGVTKVFKEMKPPEKYKEVKVEPLLLYWMPISNTSNLNPFFIVHTSSFNNPNINTTFTRLNIFSVSIYLRSLLKKGTKYIEDDILGIERRLDILNRICSKS